MARYQIHHRDHDPNNNDLDNLKVIPTLKWDGQKAQLPDGGLLEIHHFGDDRGYGLWYNQGGFSECVRSGLRSVAEAKDYAQTFIGDDDV